ncbi:MAG: ABC transporter [Woeseia sp.]|nr:ABC transporter [Woeseia sp.]
MTISFKNISHQYDGKLALSNFNLEVKNGEIVCILGPSGSGKSTLLRIAAGLEVVQNGEIYLDDQLLADPNTNPAPENRSIGLVFQDYALFPHLTVAENISFGLKGFNKVEKAKVVDKQLARVDLKDMGSRYPHTLSGGQQQRVALIRALATKPAVMLLDEPFASVDAPLREKLREQARFALKASETATLLVTHDPAEAMLMADRILVLGDGFTVQIGTPEDLWNSPKSPYIAQTFAGMQTINGKIIDKFVHTSFGAFPIERLTFSSENINEGKEISLCLRPSSLVLNKSKGQAIISDKRFLGRDFLTIATLNGEQIHVISNKPQILPVGTLVDISFDSVEALIYSK